MVRTKILAMILAVAMIVAIVPAFGLVASAAEPEHDSDYYVAIAKQSGYSFIGDNGTSSGGWHDILFGSEEANNSSWKGWTGGSTADKKVLKLYWTDRIFLDINGEGVGSLDEAGTYLSAIASPEVVEETSDKDFIIVEWSGNDGQNWGSDNGTWQDFGYADSEGKVFDTFRFNKNSADGIQYAFGSTGWIPTGNSPAANPFREVCLENTDYTYEAGSSQGTTTIDAPYRMVYVNNEDSEGYTASYYYYNGSGYTWIGTKTYTNGSVKNFGQFLVGGGNAGQRISYFKIYAGKIPTGMVEVTATYTVNGNPVKTAKGYYNVEENPEGVAFSEAFYREMGSSVLYRADATTLTADKSIEMTPVFNKGVYSYNDAVEVENDLYKVLSDNLIPNGDFSYGLNGWYDGTKAQADESKFTVNEDGTVNTTAAQSGSSANALWNSFAVEAGKTYLLHAYNEGDTATFTDTLFVTTDVDGRVEGKDDGSVIVGTTNNKETKGTNADNFPAGDFDTVFTVPEGFNYVNLWYRWHDPNVSFGKFALYEVEPYEVTVNGGRYDVVGENLATNGSFDTDWIGWTQNNAGGSFDAANSQVSGGYALVDDGHGGKYLRVDGNKGQSYYYSPTASGGSNRRVLVPTMYWSGAEAGKKYLLSFDIMTNGRSKDTDYVYFGVYRENSFTLSTYGTDFSARNDAVATGAITSGNHAKNDVWTTVYTVVDVTENGYFGFQHAWIQDYNFAGLDNFVIREVKELETAYPTKVTVDGHPEYVLYEGNVFEGDTEYAQIAEKKFALDGKIYKIAAQTVELTAEKAEVAVEAKVEQEYAATKVAHDPNSPGGSTPVGGYVAVAGKDDNMSDADGTNLTGGSVTAYGNARYMDMTFNTPKLEEGQVAILHIAAGGTRNNNGSGTGTIRLRVAGSDIYAYTTAWTNVDNNDTALATPEYQTADITDIVNAAAGETFSVKLATGRGAVGLVNEAQSGWNGVAEGYASYIEIVDGVKVTVEGAADGALITKDGAVKSTSFYALEGDTVRVYNGADNKSGLANTSVNGAKADATAKKVLGVDTTITVVAVPGQAKVELGWTGAKFAFLVTSANATDIVAGEDIWTIGEGYNGVAVVPTDTNAIYEFKGSNNGLLEGAAAEKVSIYSLVAAELATWNSADSVKEEQLDEVVNVISNGGLYIENKKLNAQADMIFDLDETTGEITLDKKLANSGIKITGIKYAINDPKDIDDATIKGDTITIPGWVELAENDATIIFLEDIEFVFDTAIGESVADETITGELDFVEEV